MKRIKSLREWTGRTWIDIGAAPYPNDAPRYRSIREGPHARARGATPGRARARPPPLLPADRERGRPGGGGGGQGPRDAGLEQLPRAHRRPTGEGGGPPGPGDLRHRPHRVAPPERHDAAPRG